jgi:Ca2+-transporting ATPase
VTGLEGLSKEAIEESALLASDPSGLSVGEAAARLSEYGPNRLPEEKTRPLIVVFLRQFLNPLIYVLLVAAVVSLLLQEMTDALFIGAVLLINAIFGTVQEYAAGRAAQALQGMMSITARVVRGGVTQEIPAEELVPGDVILLEAGQRVPADLCLMEASGMRADESMLTGESVPVRKKAKTQAGDDPEAFHAYAGTIATRGNARGVVVATGKSTKVGCIARRLGGEKMQAPLMKRMARFTLWLAALMTGVIVLMGWVALQQGMVWEHVLMMSVGIAVAAIPEGLPIALTLVLAIGMKRMARQQVIVRRLVAVEALGSCTMIATDKTGTLTENCMTITRLQAPDDDVWTLAAAEYEYGQLLQQGEAFFESRKHKELFRMLLAGGLANDADLDTLELADPVDRAFLQLGSKLGFDWAVLKTRYVMKAQLPYATTGQYAAAICEAKGRQKLHVKGSVESVLVMCDGMQSAKGPTGLDEHRVMEQMQAMAKQGLRVIALAMKELPTPWEGELTPDAMHGLTFLGLVGMEDPLRPEAASAVGACRQAGIEVVMITGDHPETAYAIGKQLGLCERPAQVMSGALIRQSESSSAEAMDALTQDAKVYARVTPDQKLQIVESLSRQGHYVAMTGDGVNDAPALAAAHVGVAMGKSGTDVARESADLILTDDRFSSIVEGIREGRVAYQNIRKVVFFLLATGMAEIVLFLLALWHQLPIPLFAVQLLWLNLVTSGMQHVGLAFEPEEGDELNRPPRQPDERIFNGRMAWRVGFGAVLIGSVAFLAFQWMLGAGYTEDAARNLTLLLMVLFENILVFTSRSENRSMFRQSLLGNRFLIIGVIAVQLLHVGAMVTPGLREVLHLSPVSLQEWGVLAGLTFAVLVVMEVEKFIWQYDRRSAVAGVD